MVLSQPRLYWVNRDQVIGHVNPIVYVYKIKGFS